LLLQLDERSSTPIWEQIVLQVKELILKNVLQPNERLLSVRELAAALLVNPNTVSKAYQELERQGVIETRRGKGTFVTETQARKGDESKVKELQQSLRLLVMESSYAGVSRDTLVEWIDTYVKEMGGDRDANRKPSE
jgi:GntR family transcriptional regulator